jgi:FKBP-type peptidyl-prolyl cis-trans isomerase (trigger factor)
MKFEELAKTFVRKELPESEVELTGEVPADTIASYREQALSHIALEMDLPGFRKGHVPQDIALKKVGEIAALEETVDLFVRDFYPELVTALGLDAVGRPQISITKLAPGNPVGLVIRTTIYPQVTLPKDWQKIGDGITGETPLPATEEEVNKTLEDVRQSRKKDDAVPELNDAFAKSIGAFESLDALKEQITKGITEEKARAAKDKRRGHIIDALLDKTAVAVPKMFIESELDKIMGQMKEDVSRFGMTFDDYVKRMNKTEEGIRNEFREQAAKRAKLQLTLNKIAQDEKIEPEKEAVDTEMKHAIEHFPEANQALLRVHIESVLRNEKVLKLLESGGEKE